MLVSIKFGATPEKGINVVKRVSLDETRAEIKFDLDRHLVEVVEGVDEANSKYGSNLEIQEIEVVPNDFPMKGQARYAAYQIAEHVLSTSFNKAIKPELK